jgi:uncharacterized protein
MFDRQILVNAGCSPAVIAHSLTVSVVALSIAERVSISVDREVVRQGGLVHDIGRSRTHGIEHAVIGAEIARKLGFSIALINIIERHIGAGIPASEAERLGLPGKDYIPLTPEEKIVSYADNLISGVVEVPFSKALERFKTVLGPDHEGVCRFIRQHEEIQSWMK